MTVSRVEVLGAASASVDATTPRAVFQTTPASFHFIRSGMHRMRLKSSKRVFLPDADVAFELHGYGGCTLISLSESTLFTLSDVTSATCRDACIAKAGCKGFQIGQILSEFYQSSPQSCSDTDKKAQCTLLTQICQLETGDKANPDAAVYTITEGETEVQGA